jgi:FixJ family two-component response regulator
MFMRSARVAIVEDDAGVRKALARLLDASSFQTEIFGSAREFLASLADHRPDCLVADLQMPEMSGLGLHAHLTDAGLAIPTVIITAHNGDGVRERCAAAGAQAYLVKPIQHEVLIAAINAAIGQS